MFLLLTITGVLVLYILFDVNYFIRLFLSTLWTFMFQTQLSIFDKATVYSFCWTTDMDMCNHMNNARYLRELDFARYNFYQRSGIFKQMWKEKKIILQNATQIRHRLPVKLFSLFKINTQLLYFEKKCIYLKQEFITLHGKSLQAVVLSRQSLRNGNIDDVLEELTNGKKLVLKEEVKVWMQSLDLSNKSSTDLLDTVVTRI